MKTVIGDAVLLAANNNGIILHQVNCQRTAGKGIAKQIRDRFPGWFESYATHKQELGEIHVFQHNKTFIVSLFGQNGYAFKPDSGFRFTNYDAFELGLSRLAIELNKTPLKDAVLYIPFGIGCGLGGGKWDVISKLLESYVPDAVLVKYE